MIAESELILNNRGGIYHIDMRNEELADIVITVGDQDRVDRVCQYFSDIECSASHREFRWKTGVYNGTRMTVISTGIGPDNIDIVLNELDAVANIDFNTREIKNQHRSLKIIRLGTTGGLDENIPVDTPVVSVMAVGLDNVLPYYQPSYDATERSLMDEMAKLPFFEATGIRPYAASASTELISKFDDNWVKGITLTAPGFYGPQGRKLRAQGASPDFIDQILGMPTHMEYGFSNFEMETATILGLSKILGHQGTAVSTIVANRMNKTFSANPQTAIQEMIESSIEIIAKF